MSLKDENTTGLKHLEAILNNIPNALRDICINQGLKAISEVTKNLPLPIRTALTNDIVTRDNVNADNRPTNSRE